MAIDLDQIIKGLIDVEPIAEIGEALDDLCRMQLSQIEGIVSSDAKLLIAKIISIEGNILNSLNESQDISHSSMAAYVEISSIAVKNIKQLKYASYLLGIISFVSWSRVYWRSEHFKYQLAEYLFYSAIATNMIQLSLNVGAFDAAKAIATHLYTSFQLLGSYDWISELDDKREELREIGVSIRQKLFFAIRNLADDIQNWCHESHSTLTPYIGALAWTLGMVPESLLFKNGEGVTLSKRFFIRIVSNSIESIPNDALTRAMWLTILAESGMDFSPHYALLKPRILFYLQYQAGINGIPTRLKDLIPGGPGDCREYARLLVAWFAGHISLTETELFLQNICQIISGTYEAHLDPQFVRDRILVFGLVLARQFNIPPSDSSIQIFEMLISAALLITKQLDLHPEITNVHDRIHVPFFYCVESILGLSQANNESIRKEQIIVEVVRIIETFRATANEFWLKTSQPVGLLDPEKYTPRIKELLKQEDDLLQFLRGAYFLIIYPHLPAQFRIYGIPNPDERPELMLFNKDEGYKQVKEINRDLESVYQRMEEVMPDYAKRRINNQVGIPELFEAISRHKRRRLAQDR